MSLWKEYYTPTSIAEALRIRAQHGHDAQFVAGGTDLILDLQQGNHTPLVALVDVTTIHHLNEIHKDGAWIVLGAAVTHSDVEANPLVKRHGTALAESCGVVGGPQVRNVGTLGGNVAHALPAADGTIGLLALEAEVQVCTLQDSEVVATWQPLLSIFAGPGKSKLGDNQMLAAFRFRTLQPRQASAFDRIMRPQGVALPILGVAAKLALDESLQRVVRASIAVGPVGPIPFRASAAEQILLDAPVFDAAAVDAAVQAALAQAELRTSKHRASKEYRREVLDVLLRRVLRRAFERAQTEPGA
ncbi:MAG: FAD binding domain-containing protein [Caldilineaceae bacterium]